MPINKAASKRKSVDDKVPVRSDAISCSVLLLTSFISFFCLPFVQASAQSNTASPLGTNLAGITYYSPEQPFLNILKNGIGWNGNAGGTNYNENQFVFKLDSNGYPTSMVANGTGPAGSQTFTNIATLVYNSTGIRNGDGTESAPFYPAGWYLFQFQGSGTFYFTGDASGSCSSSPCAFQVTNPTAYGIQLVMTATGAGSNYAHNMSIVYCNTYTSNVCGTGYDALLASGEIFNPTFIARINQFGTLRFMNWANANYSPQQNWTNRPTLTQAFWGVYATLNQPDPMPDGVPAEAMVALCNEIGANGWFNMPILATDDYVAQFATLVHANLKAGLKAYVEYGDEIWNCLNGACTGGLLNELIALGEAAFPNYDSAWGAGFYYGILRAVQNGATWKNVWGADSARVIRVVGGQTGYNGPYGRNAFILSFTAGMYGGNPSNFTGTVAQNVDVFADAPYLYFGSVTVPDTFTLDQLFTEIMSGGLIPGDYPGGLIAQTLNQIAGDLATAQTYGLPLVAYEGGQSLIATDSTLNNLFAAANRDPRMGTAYTTLLNGWKSLGGTLFNSFSDFTQYNNWGYWGMLENLLQTSSPKYDALMNFISANPCWWSGCATSGTSTTTTPAVATTTPPSVPRGLAGAVASATQINLTWTASTDSAGSVAGYNVFRNGTKVGTSTNTSYQDTGLSAGTKYTYAVSAYDTAGNTSAQSSGVSVSTPAPPTIVINSPRNGTLLEGKTNLNIAATASDASGIVSITISAGKSILQTCTNVTSCSASWNSLSIPRGTQVISATAVDKYGLQARASVTIVSLR